MLLDGKARLVNAVGDGVSRVQLDLGEGSLGGSWGGGNDSLQWGWGSNNWSGVVGQWGTKELWGVGTSVSVGAISVGTSVWEASVAEWGKGSQWGQWSSGSWGGPLLAGTGLLESLQVGSGGGSDLRGWLWSNWELWVEDWGNASVDWSNWELWVEDWGLALEDWGNWQVGGLDAESKGISLVVGGLELAVGINIAVGAADKAEGSVALLGLGRVDVAVSVGKVGELILGVELLGQWGSWDGGNGGDWGSSSNSGDWSGSNEWGTSVDWGAQTSVATEVWVNQDLGVGRGSQGGNSSDKSLHSESVLG